jgi:hypothetical protein
MIAERILKDLHKKSRNNRQRLVQARRCGCFNCLSEFPASEIAGWIDGGVTALCPVCGVDAVLGFAAAIADREILGEMHARWFEASPDVTPITWDETLERDAWPASALKSAPRK